MTTEYTYPITTVTVPESTYDAEEVIAIQLSAFADNDSPVPDAGIKTAYNFASPANRRATGPFDQFRQMVQNNRYAPMIDHNEAVTGPLEQDGDSAQQRVTLTGEDGQTVTYRFGVSKYESTPEDETIPEPNCWLTDRVLRE
ncbi:DUF4864 domain-containing protein [Haloquadratum walsbyi]|jgi:hypothetical protein|uniref:Uncharacterized protein n=1 Tax=Haloquadratum walsbyi (strain DSM 16854 / JCM 12705 / C23) TaxID=768065 RepID=G0LKX1_HALWC|nr:DUF4864 domain-containing protein [Haloquadratum walsbyi]CCC40411.1 uncharacterized protein Hqrw_2572 [Haloquadratum walsbyi C23]